MCPRRLSSSRGRSPTPRRSWQLDPAGLGASGTSSAGGPSFSSRPPTARSVPPCAAGCRLARPSQVPQVAALERSLAPGLDIRLPLVPALDGFVEPQPAELVHLIPVVAAASHLFPEGTLENFDQGEPERVIGAIRPKGPIQNMVQAASCVR